jgi:hypothetical protein
MAVQKLLKSQSLKEQEMLADKPDVCKAFVLAMYTNNLRSPVRLRSYHSQMGPATSNITIWEAARATTATPIHFSPIVASDGSEYMEASPGYTNPIFEAYDEAVRIWQPDGIRCLVSIGTGVSKPVRLDGFHTNDSKSLGFSSVLNLATRLLNSATDTQPTHIVFARMAKLLNLKYFRFDVPNSLDVAKNEYTNIAESQVLSETQPYLSTKDTEVDIKNCAHLLQNR